MHRKMICKFKNRVAAVLIASFMALAMTSCGNSGTAPTSSTSLAESGSQSSATAKTLSNDELFMRAVKDAVFIEEDEVLPLVNINRDDENIVWDDKGRVLVSFMHKYPDSYPAGEDIELKWGNVWCVPDKELCKWVRDNSEGVADWSLRLHQVLGMPTTKAYTHITALWVDAGLLYRPANVSDPNKKMEVKYTPTGDEKFDKTFKEWLDSNIVWSYFDSALPWTRLGYTYDWADNGKEYGVSEFLVFNGAKAKVEYTLDVDEYVKHAKSYK